jgi:hypothetical protein
MAIDADSSRADAGGCMKRRTWRTRAGVIFMLALLPVSAPWAFDLFWKMHEAEGATLLTKQTKTVCVGRFLIDVPATAQVSIGSAAVDGVDMINYGAETLEQFASRLALREDKINAEKNRAGGSSLESVQEIEQDAVQGKLFVFDRRASYYLSNGEKIPTLSVSVNAYAHVSGMSIGFIARVYKPQDVPDLLTLMARLQPIEKSGIPKQPGFCMDRVLLRGPGTPDQAESIVMFAGLPGHEDLGIALTTIAGKAPGPGLIERTDANRAGPYAFLNLFTSTLLKGRRTINGLEGEELAIKARERNLTTGYAFDWESQGTGDDILRPFVSLELQTGFSPRADGAPRQSSLSEASLGDLWRGMSSSLRLHSVAISPAPAPPR